MKYEFDLDFVFLNNFQQNANFFSLCLLFPLTFDSEVINSFNGSSFIANGPRMLTRVFQEICNNDNRSLWTYEQCRGLRIQPKETFFPVSWTDFMLYFDPEKLRDTLEMIQSATVIHVWNDRSKDIWNPIGTRNAYHVLAERNCPRIYHSSKYL